MRSTSPRTTRSVRKGVRKPSGPQARRMREQVGDAKGVRDSVTPRIHAPDEVGGNEQ